jgi:hypothetical protein
MNIFVLHDDPEVCARYHVDKHVVKMIVESAQMLSTVMRVRADIDFGYKACYINHPCTKWVGESFENWHWLLKLGIQLGREYTHRFGKRHATSDVLLGVRDHMHRMMITLNDNCCELSSGGMTPFYPCVSERFKKYDPVTAYRLYYYFQKVRLHKWTKREVPHFIKSDVDSEARRFAPIPYPHGYELGLDPSYI